MSTSDGGLQFLSSVTHDVVELLPVVGAGRGAGRLEALQPPPACFGVVASGPFHELTVFDAVPVSKGGSTLYPQAPTAAEVAKSLVGRDYTSVTLGKQAKVAVPCSWGAGRGTFLVVLHSAVDTVRFYTSRAKGAEKDPVSFAPVWYRTQGGLGIQSIRAAGSFCVMRRVDSRWVGVMAESVACRELGVLPCPSGTILTTRLELLTGEGVRGTAIFVAVGKAGDAVVYNLSSSAFTVQTEVPKADEQLGSYPLNPALVAIDATNLRLAAVHQPAPDTLSISERALTAAGTTHATWSVACPGGIVTPKGLVPLTSRGAGTYAVVYVEETEVKNGSTLYHLCVTVLLANGSTFEAAKSPLYNNRWDKHVTVSLVSRAVGGGGRPYRLEEDIVVSIGSELYGIDVSSSKVQKAIEVAGSSQLGTTEVKAKAIGGLAAMLAGTSQSKSAAGTVVRDSMQSGGAAPATTKVPAFYAEHATFASKPSAAELYKYCSSVSDWALESLVTLLYYIADILAPTRSLGEQAAIFMNCIAHLPVEVLGGVISNPFQMWLRALSRRVASFEASQTNQANNRLLVPVLGMLYLTYLTSLNKGFVDAALLCTKTFDALVVAVGKAVGSQPDALALVTKMESCLKATGNWASQEAGKKLGQISAHCTEDSPATKQAMYVPVVPFRVRTQTGTEITTSLITLNEPPRK